MAKKKNSRKALALVLGVVGVAGLSLASASQLAVTPGAEAAMGTSVSAFAACDDAVGIEYDYNGNYLIDEVTVTGIAAACDGQTVTFSIENLTNTNAPITGSGVANDSGSLTIAIGSPSVSIESDLGVATVVISN